MGTLKRGVLGKQKLSNYSNTNKSDVKLLPARQVNEKRLDGAAKFNYYVGARYIVYCNLVSDSAVAEVDQNSVQRGNYLIHWL